MNKLQAPWKGKSRWLIIFKNTSRMIFPNFIFFPVTNKTNNPWKIWNLRTTNYLFSLKITKCKFILNQCKLGIRTKVRTHDNSQGVIIVNEKKINVSILLRVLTNKITHMVQWSKSNFLQPILTFVHSNLCPSTVSFYYGMNFTGLKIY